MTDDAATGVGPQAVRVPARFDHLTSGLEALDRFGIDIDQDPRAFARFLELRRRGFRILS